MGVANLWKALEKGGAVTKLDGAQPGDHARILQELENTAVAVDLSAWLVQATTQQALVGVLDSPQACVLKVVFDRTIHWLRHGVLPVFVIEGRTPPEKLERLRQRAAAQGSGRIPVYGNRAGGHFDQLGQLARRLAEALGVPCVQAVGEAEATCAALNVAGWVSGCHTADVDALLFGAQTVYRHLHLQMDDARKTQLSLCKLSAVQGLLGLSSGGHQALLAVAQLAGGDYDVAGAERVGDTLAITAVKTLLEGQEDDHQLLAALQSALEAGPDPALEALSSCTGCKTCGHEGSRKARVARHTPANPCQQCLEEHGGLPEGAWCWPAAAGAGGDGEGGCSCRFHATAGQRQLNRVVGRAARTPGFLDACSSALAAYQQQIQDALAAVQQQYGLAAPGTPNVFTWRQRPDVRAVADLMRSYLSAWDYRLVRVKLLPLLLEWDVRQGPGAGGVQLRPVDIKKAVPAPGAAAGGAGDRGWCYLVKLDRVAEDREVLAAGAAPGSSSGQSLSAAAGGTPVSNSSQSRTGLVLQGGVRWRQPLQLPPGTTQDQEDWVIDCAWLAGQGKGWAAPPGLAAVLAPTSSMGGGGATQGGLTQGSLFGEEGEGEEGEGEEGRGPRLLSGTCKPEHRYLRCSLLEGVWPDLVAAWRDRADAKRSGATGRGKAAATPGAANTKKAPQPQQGSLKDYFATVKGGATRVAAQAKAAGSAAVAAAAAAVGQAGPTPGSSRLVVAASAMSDAPPTSDSSRGGSTGGRGRRAGEASGGSRGRASGRGRGRVSQAAVAAAREIITMDRFLGPAAAAGSSSKQRPGADADAAGASSSAAGLKPSRPSMRQGGLPLVQEEPAPAPAAAAAVRQQAAGIHAGPVRAGSGRELMSAGADPGSSLLLGGRRAMAPRADWMSPYLEALRGDSDTPADSDPLLQGSPLHSPNQQQQQVPRQRQQQQQGGVAGSRVQVVHTGALLPGLTAAAARAAQQLGAAGAGGTGAAGRDAAERSPPPVVNLLEGSDSEEEIAPLWQRLRQSQAGQQTSRASQPSKGAPAPPQQQQLSPPPALGRSSRSAGPPLDDSEGSPAKRGRMTGPWEPAHQHQGSPLAAPRQGLQAGYAALLEDVGGPQGGSHRAGQLAVPAGAAPQQRRVRGLFKDSARSSQQQQQQQQDLKQEQEKAEGEGEEGDGWRVVVGSQGQDVILLT